VTGDSINDLIALSGDPNTSIEDKTFTCQVRAGRRATETTARLAGAGRGDMPTDAPHEAERPDRQYHAPNTDHEPPLEAT
jgi:hypothetical protein